MNGRLHSQDGAVAVIVAVFVAFVGIGLLVIALDGGSLLQSRRALVIDTDAAAHGGAVAMAQDWLERDATLCDPAVGTAEADRMLDVNNPDDEVVDVDADCDPDEFSGWVRMTALQPSPGFVSGRTDLAAGGTTTVEFRLGVSAFDRGLAVCEALFQGTGSLTSEFTLDDDRLAIPFNSAAASVFQETGSACGIDEIWMPGGTPSTSTKGGWGWIDPNVPCVPDVESGFGLCEQSTGTTLNGGLGPYLDQSIRFPIFDAWDGNPGTNGRFRIVGYLQATVEQLCRVPGGGSAPADPQECNDSDRLNTNFAGNPDFIIVSDAAPFFFDAPETAMFDEASYSICDVGAGTDFCP